ncbi:hypothetical protein WJX81_007617 [Elliptochloris bilobata]|uniref:Uncharacterized protein n=1 Tax=Elliptochloris bilobata TaxID=381761 RepID=A0AAW1SLL3_9CHLO
MSPSFVTQEEVRRREGGEEEEEEERGWRALAGAGGLAVQVAQCPEDGLSFQVWPSALQLARYAEHSACAQAGCWAGRRVLELGCGCGLVGLVFAALGARVLLTDLPEPQALIRQNIAINAAAIAGAGGAAEAAVLAWGVTDPASLPGAWATLDLVIAADVVYHRDLFGPLLATLAAFGAAGVPILLAHVRRWKSDRHFFARARRIFDVIDVTSALY